MASRAIPPTQSLPGDFTVHFGTASVDVGGLALPIPLLGGEGTEKIFSGLQAESSSEGFAVFSRGGLLIGAVDEAVEADLSAQTYRLYHRLLRLSAGRKLVRVWNYVSRINELDTDGLENYRAFCVGRAQALEERFGDDYALHLPAASAVGGVNGRLAVIFVATQSAPEHVENPDQTPAYGYPVEYGPRAPSFARATKVAEAGSRFVFISGTAAIKGHATIAPGSLADQIACTVDNLRIVSRACGLGDRLGESAGSQRHFKVYLRHADDFAAAVRALDGELFIPTDRVTWLQADICRSDLLIEIEATLVGSA